MADVEPEAVGACQHGNGGTSDGRPEDDERVAGDEDVFHSQIIGQHRVAERRTAGRAISLGDGQEIVVSVV